VSSRNQTELGGTTMGHSMMASSYNSICKSRRMPEPHATPTPESGWHQQAC
jgi:hypothetical protein